MDEHEAKGKALMGEHRMVSLGSVKVADRGRKLFPNQGELTESIRRFGLDNPLTVAPLEGDDRFQWVLVAGERRYRSLVMLGWREIPVKVRADWDEVNRKEFEAEENVQREGLAWDERIELERQVDALKRARHMREGKPGTWNIADTAKVLGVSPTVIQRDVAFAKELLDRPDLKEAVRHLPKHAAMKRVEKIKQAEAGRLRAAGTSREGTIKRGDSRQLLTGVRSASIAAVVTDPPFGVSTLEANRGRGVNVQTSLLTNADNLGEQGTEKLFKWFLPELARVLLPSGHFYIFTCQQMWAKLREGVLAAGLELQEYPLIWYKGRGTAPGRGYCYTPCCEPIMFGWKPPRARLLDRSMIAHVECKPISSAEALHPFQKPVDLMRTLIEQSTVQGELVLDPFCGSGSTVVAAVKASRVGIGFDLDPTGLVTDRANARVERALLEMKGAKP